MIRFSKKQAVVVLPVVGVTVVLGMMMACMYHLQGWMEQTDGERCWCCTMENMCIHLTDKET
jgi:hypothetical protein